MDLLRLPGDGENGLRRVIEELNALAGSRLQLADDPKGAARTALNSRVDRSGEAADGRSRSKTVAQVMALVKPFWPSMGLLLALSVGAVTIDVLPPMLQRVLVDDVLQVKTPANSSQRLLVLLLAVVGGLLLLRLSAASVAIGKGWVSSRVGADMTAKLRMTLVEKLSQLPLAFYDRNQVGKLMSQVAYDTETLHTLVYHLTGGFLLQLLQLVGIGVMLCFLNVKLAVITLLPMPLIVAGGWYFTRSLHPMNQRYWEAVGRQAAALMGILSGIQVVKAFVQEEREMRRFRESSGRLRDSRVTVDASLSTFTAAMGLLFALGTLAVWYVGGRDVLVAKMTLGSLVAFLAYLAMFYTPLTAIAESTSWFASFYTTMHRMSNLMEAPSEAAGSAGGNTPPRFRGHVEFRNVNFAYDKNHPVLKNVTLSIAPGEMVGVVGRSGSGKSTLVNLICRLYEVDAGNVLIDGIDVRELDPHAMRRQIGMVPQAPFLFRGSVAENIIYGNPAATPEHILLAAQDADAHEFIMRMPLAYDSELGDGGTGLSGGERQRLSIARALLFDPAILILDEATASVDAESERAICNAIRRWAKQRTTILIAHRLSTLQDADRLFVFDHGRLAEEGKHEELIHDQGLYNNLAQLQGLHGGPRVENEPAVDRRVRWIDPADSTIEEQSGGLLRVDTNGCSWDGVFAVRAFPATHKDNYLSLRRRKPDGHDQELGMIHSLDAWPTVARVAVQRAMARRYLLQPIDDIRQIRSHGNQITLLVSSNGAVKEVRLDNRGDGFQRFGSKAVLLLDSRGSYYVIADRSTLPKRQRNLLELYFGD